jgi:hypothetical protein
VTTKGNQIKCTYVLENIENITKKYKALDKIINE